MDISLYKFNKEEKIMNGVDLNKLSKNKETFKQKNPKRVQGLLSPDDCKRVETKLKEIKGFKEDDSAPIALAVLCQQGATSVNAQNQLSYDIEGQTVTGKDIQKTIKEVDKNFTVRKYARSKATEIHNICEILEVEGDLAKKRALKYPNQTLEEAIWASNFQTMNRDCIAIVKEWLVENLNEKFPDQNRY